MWSCFPNWPMHWQMIKCSVLFPSTPLPIELYDWTQLSRTLLLLSGIHCRLLQSQSPKTLPCNYTKHTPSPCLLPLKDSKAYLSNTPSPNCIAGSHTKMLQKHEAIVGSQLHQSQQIDNL